MSKYKQIVTQFKNLESLKKALEDVGFAGIEVAPNPKAPSLTLVGFLGDARPEKASLRIPRRYVGSLANDVGFAWNPKSRTYEAIISEFDSSAHFDEGRLNHVKQRYAFHELVRSARIEGYEIGEATVVNGTVEFQLIRR